MRLTVLIFFATSASAQFIALGVKGGMPLTQAYDAKTNPALAGGGLLDFVPACIVDGCESANERTVPYVIGPAIEIRVRGPFRVNVEGLYSRAIYEYISEIARPDGSEQGVVAAKHAVSRWDFPFLLKYTVPRWHGLYPFVAAGASIQYSRDYTVSRLGGDLFSRRISVLSGGPSTRSTIVGPTFGAGVSFGASRMRPSLEFRYTRWVDQPIVEGKSFNSFSFTSNKSLHSTQNQAELLLGLMF